MAMNPLLKQLVDQTAAKNAKRDRDQYLPRASVLDKLCAHDRVVILDAHRRRLEQEVCRTVLATDIGRRKFLKAARDRMKRLERLAQSYGHWLPEPAQSGLSKAEREAVLSYIEKEFDTALKQSR